MECTICIQPFTAISRKEIKCPYCLEIACTQCIKGFIMQSVEDACCFSCKRAYSSDMIDKHFSKTWRKNDLRKHRIQLLMERERSLFPDTQLVIEREFARQQYQNVYTLHSSLLMSLSPRDTKPVSEELVRQINDARLKLKELQDRVSEVTVEKREFVRKCPNCEDGFLSTQWKCGLCSCKVCNHCLEVKTENHECKPENIMSAKTIESQTKPCPSCGVRVQKISGCTQMWCTSCKNAFDWTSGRKIDGIIHNPHYHEYAMANTNWNLCQENAGVWPWHYSPALARALANKTSVGYLTQEQSSTILRVNRCMIESSVMIQNFLPYSPDMYLALRKRRILKEINDAQWASLLSARETARERQRRMLRLEEFLVSVAKDILARYLAKDWSTTEFDTMLVEFKNARLYYNEQMAALGEKHHMTDTWTRYIYI